MSSVGSKKIPENPKSPYTASLKIYIGILVIILITAIIMWTVNPGDDQERNAYITLDVIMGVVVVSALIIAYTRGEQKFYTEPGSDMKNVELENHMQNDAKLMILSAGCLFLKPIIWLYFMRIIVCERSCGSSNPVGCCKISQYCDVPGAPADNGNIFKLPLQLKSSGTSSAGEIITIETGMSPGNFHYLQEIIKIDISYNIPTSTPDIRRIHPGSSYGWDWTSNGLSCYFSNTLNSSSVQETFIQALGSCPTQGLSPSGTSPHLYAKAVAGGFNINLDPGIVRVGKISITSNSHENSILNLNKTKLNFVLTSGSTPSKNIWQNYYSRNKTQKEAVKYHNEHNNQGVSWNCIDPGIRYPPCNLYTGPHTTKGDPSILPHWNIIRSSSIYPDTVQACSYDKGLGSDKYNTGEEGDNIYYESTNHRLINNVQDTPKTKTNSDYDMYYKAGNNSTHGNPKTTIVLPINEKDKTVKCYVKSQEQMDSPDGGVSCGIKHFTHYNETTSYAPEGNIPASNGVTGNPLLNGIQSAVYPASNSFCFRGNSYDAPPTGNPKDNLISIKTSKSATANKQFFNPKYPNYNLGTDNKYHLGFNH